MRMPEIKERLTSTLPVLIGQDAKEAAQTLAMQLAGMAKDEKRLEGLLEDLPISFDLSYGARLCALGVTKRNVREAMSNSVLNTQVFDIMGEVVGDAIMDGKDLLPLMEFIRGRGAEERKFQREVCTIVFFHKEQDDVDFNISEAREELERYAEE